MRADYQRRLHQGRRHGVSEGCQVPDDLDCWQNLSDLRRVYPSADLVAVGSGKSVIVVNGCGSTYRLIAAVHFDHGMVYTLRFFTQAEYSKDKWKDEL